MCFCQWPSSPSTDTILQSLWEWKSGSTYPHISCIAIPTRYLGKANYGHEWDALLHGEASKRTWILDFSCDSAPSLNIVIGKVRMFQGQTDQAIIFRCSLRHSTKRDEMSQFGSRLSGVKWIHFGLRDPPQGDGLSEVSQGCQETMTWSLEVSWMPAEQGRRETIRMLELEMVCESRATSISYFGRSDITKRKFLKLSRRKFSGPAIRQNNAPTELVTQALKRQKKGLHPSQGSIWFREEGMQWGLDCTEYFQWKEI